MTILKHKYTGTWPLKSQYDLLAWLSLITEKYCKKCKSTKKEYYRFGQLHGKHRKVAGNDVQIQSKSDRNPKHLLRKPAENRGR